MSQIPPEFENAANAAAARVKGMIVDMLLSGEVGEVAVIVSVGHLDPQKRVTTRAKAVKVGRGRMRQLERVE